MYNKTIFITGTPGVGKTTVSNLLVDILKDSYDVKLIRINDLAFENNLIIDENLKKDYKIIDIEKLDLYLQENINNFLKVENNKSTIVIVEGHLSHFCSNPDLVFVLRLNPSILEERLISRNYSSDKIKENLEAESLAVCSNEAYEIHENKVNEINTSNLNIDCVVSLILQVVNNESEFPPGNVNFMDWILENF
ncbi:adenylate kinase family protein [Methanobrevibacter sp. DSM 116169]|uniref:adenylate kinase family protein n=1 Tax=Methanobrevibacter sp. DSM 116169 TaxID=3242727 RepID=UPI0038FC7E7C